MYLFIYFYLCECQKEGIRYPGTGRGNCVPLNIGVGNQTRVHWKISK